MPDWQREHLATGVTARSFERPVGHAVAACRRMLLFRSISVGLLGACLVMLVQLRAAQQEQRVEQAVQSLRIEVPRLPSMLDHVPEPAVSVVDVGRGVPVATVLSLLRIAPDERIASVDDQAVDNDPFAGVLLADAVRAGPRYVDLTIARRIEPMQTRRLLILLH